MVNSQGRHGEEREIMKPISSNLECRASQDETFIYNSLDYSQIFYLDYAHQTSKDDRGENNTKLVANMYLTQCNSYVLYLHLDRQSIIREHSNVT